MEPSIIVANYLEYTYELYAAIKSCIGFRF